MAEETKTEETAEAPVEGEIAPERPMNRAERRAMEKAKKGGGAPTFGGNFGSGGHGAGNRGPFVPRIPRQGTQRGK